VDDRVEHDRPGPGPGADWLTARSAVRDDDLGVPEVRYGRTGAATQSGASVLPTSSTPFADLVEHLDESLIAAGHRIAGVLDSATDSSPFDPVTLARSLHAEPDVVVRVLEAAANRGLLIGRYYILCPACGTPLRLDVWTQRFARCDEVECPTDRAEIPASADRARMWEVAPQALAAVLPRMANPMSALILCALDLERQAVIAHLTGAAFESRQDARYAVGVVAGANAQWSVAVGVTGPLMQTAAAATAAAIAANRPDVAIFLGVAGGRKDVKRGDVAVADLVTDISAGKEGPDGLVVRNDVHRPTHAALHAARQVLSEGRWLGRQLIESPDGTQPKAVIGPIAVSNRVIASDTGELSRAIATHADRAIGVETESAGFLAALYLTKEVDSLVVRAISDARIDKTDDDDTDWQPAAADHAAAFAVEVLRVW
jgi:nucleoside phosphorylase